MKKRILPIPLVLVVLAFLLTSCAQGGTTRQPSSNFRTGSQGLTMNFVPNLPPSQVYDDQDLDIVIELENRGAADVGFAGDKIYLSGFDKNILQIEPVGSSAQIPQLQGKTEFGPGDRSQVSFKSRSISLSQNVDRLDIPLLATMCYDYETVASASVCIDPDPYSLQQKVCTPSAVSLGTQGAPIAVSSATVEPSKGRARFKIDIRNVGGGEVFRHGTTYLSKCSPYDSEGLQFSDMDYVRVAEVSIGGQSILNDCNPALDDGHLRLINGQATIFCNLRNIQGNTAYTTPITVRLQYGYRQTQRKNLRILKIR